MPAKELRILDGKYSAAKVLRAIRRLNNENNPPRENPKQKK